MRSRKFKMTKITLLLFMISTPVFATETKDEIPSSLSPQATQELVNIISDPSHLVNVSDNASRNDVLKKENILQIIEIYKSPNFSPELGDEWKIFRQKNAIARLELRDQQYKAEQIELLKQKLAEIDATEPNAKAKLAYELVALTLFKQSSPATGLLLIDSVYTSIAIPQQNLVSMVRKYNNLASKSNDKKIPVRNETDYQFEIRQILSGASGARAAQKMQSAIAHFYKTHPGELYARVFPTNYMDGQNDRRVKARFTSLYNHLLFAGNYRLLKAQVGTDAMDVIRSEQSGELTGQRIFNNREEYETAIRRLHTFLVERRSISYPESERKIPASFEEIFERSFTACLDALQIP